MKTKFILLLFSIVCLAHCGLCQPQLSNISYPQSVNLFDLFEVSFKLNVSFSNPYDPNDISVSAEFVSTAHDTIHVNGFYYEDYTFYKQDGYEHYNTNPFKKGWRIRFTPNVVGLWTFRLFLTDVNGSTVYPANSSYSFTCNAVTDGVGFISKANTRFLKRDVVTNGNRSFHSYFPIGTDVAWYSCKDSLFQCPKGIYEYESFSDKMQGNCNYMRVFLNRYEYLSLYGPEYTQMSNGAPTVYFNSTINQKDAAEFDKIVEITRERGINLTACVFTCSDFEETSKHPESPSVWTNNPFNTVMHLSSPCDFFTDTDAKKVTKNLLRYIVARWGYATNIIDWELWNEVDGVFGPCDSTVVVQNTLAWHNEMANYIRENDPFGHCVSSSTKTNSTALNSQLYQSLFTSLDLVKRHKYAHIQKAKSLEQVSYLLFKEQETGHSLYPDKPFHLEEFGFGPHVPSVHVKDPYGIDIHNSLWASLFSCAMGPGSHWWWYYLSTKNLFVRYKPLLTFCSDLPIPSDSFRAFTTGTSVDNKWLVFPNNIETYYMKNATEDTIYGWCQDTAFAYQSLRWLTDSVWLSDTLDPGNIAVYSFIDTVVFDPNGYVYTMSSEKKPRPSSNSNNIFIPIENQPVGAMYNVDWYDSETGLHLFTASYAIVQKDQDENKFITFRFPSIIRDLANDTITNAFGDAVFKVQLMQSEHPHNEDNRQ